MDDRGDERDDTRGGLGLGGPQRGPIGGDNDNGPDQGGTGGRGEGQQRRPGGSSRDSENLK